MSELWELLRFGWKVGTGWKLRYFGSDNTVLFEGDAQNGYWVLVEGRECGQPLDEG